MCRSHRRLLASVIRRNATGDKSSLAVAEANDDDGSEAHPPFNVRLVIVRLNGRLPHSSRTRQWRWPSPAPGAALRMVFVGGSGATRSAPAVKPSAQPFSPPPRSTDGAHINPCGPTGGRQAVHQCQTQGDAYEATRAGRTQPDAVELGRALPRPGFGAPGTGLPYDGPNPQDA